MCRARRRMQATLVCFHSKSDWNPKAQLEDTFHLTVDIDTQIVKARKTCPSIWRRTCLCLGFIASFWIMRWLSAKPLDIGVTND